MGPAVILSDYILWHYTTALEQLFIIWRNLLWFFGHFFSLATLAKSLFAPWKRITEQRTKRFSLEDWASTVLINFMSRLIGFVFRSVIIMVGLMVIVVWCALFPILYAGWLLLPPLIVGLCVLGIGLIV